MTDGRSYSHEVLEHCRFRAIKLSKQGEKVNDIARFLGVHRGCVSKWITMYRRKGKEALKSRKSQGPSFKLTSQETNQVLHSIKTDAMAYGFETPLWTCNRVKHVIKKETGKTLHTTSIMRLFRRCKLSPQKPERQARQQDEKAVKRWLKEEWPEIQKHVKRWQAMLYFMDEAGVSLIPVMGKTWAPKGETPIVKVTGKRGGFCVTSAISPAGKMIFRLEKGKINAGKHVEFLEQIMEHHPNRKIIVIEDRAPPHRGKKVKDFAEGNKRRFAVYYLPAYAPKLNPGEHVWEYLKAYKLKAHQAQTTDELRKLVKGKMHGIQQKKGLVRSFFIGTYVI
jgi:transposase